MKRLVGTCLLLAGCVNTDALDTDLQALVDQNVQEVMRYIGYPDSLRDVAGQDTVYVWSTHRILHGYGPNAQTTIGDVGGDPILMTAINAKTTVSNRQCAIVLLVDHNSIVKRYQIVGDRAECSKYNRALRR